MKTTLRGWRTASVCLGVACAFVNAAACGSSSATSPAIDDGGSDAGSAIPDVPVVSEDAGAPLVPADAGTDAAPTDAGHTEAGIDAAPPAAAVYVAPTGSDTAAGTMTAPLKTAQAGINAAEKANRPLYLCTTSFSENVTIKGALAIDGSRDCANGWAATTSSATIAPATGIPITVSAGTAGVSISYVHAVAPDAVAAGGSSIGLLVQSSAKVSVAHSEISAGNGSDGATPPAPEPVTAPAPSGANGESLASFACPLGSTDPSCATVATGGHSAIVVGCYGPAGAGGAGGNQTNGNPAQPGAPGGYSGYGGAGGTATDGLPGSPGMTGPAGLPATNGFGTITAAGYLPTNSGTDGQGGLAGGGGGGGAGGYSGVNGQLCSIYFLGGGGGEGGYGGCGGQGTKGAGGGGASIAVIAFDSPLTLSDVILDTASGGRGGASAAGSVGQPGGSGGLGGTGSHADGATGCTPNPTGGDASNGGAGARGGKGGAGGPGGGGPSIGIVSTISEPTLATVTYNLGAAGTGGRSITGGDGANGVSSERWFIDATGAGSP